jgi:hypothetical protein
MRSVRNIQAAPPAPRADGEVRCGCGSLLARLAGAALELKCRRCKRVWRLPVEGAPPGGVAAGRAG